MTETPAVDQKACFEAIGPEWEVCARQTHDESGAVIWRYDEGFSEAVIESLRERGMVVTSPRRDPSGIVMLVKRAPSSG